MSGLVIHAVVYVAVIAMLFFFWAVGDQPEDATGVDATPWPLFVAVPWGAALAVHAAVVLVALPRRVAAAMRARRAPAGDQPDAASGTQAGGGGRGGSGGSPMTPQRQWVVILFTDIARSTPLAESLGDMAFAEMIGEHRRQVRSIVARHHGTEIGTQGDGFLCRFGAPDAAVRAAVDLQRALATARAEGTAAPEVRIGIHAGDAVSDSDDDLVGRAVNLAARVMGLAGPGEILVTEPVADQLAVEHRLQDRGLRDLKGIDRPRHLLAVDWQAELDVAGSDPTDRDDRKIADGDAAEYGPLGGDPEQHEDETVDVTEIDLRSDPQGQPRT